MHMAIKSIWHGQILATVAILRGGHALGAGLGVEGGGKGHGNKSKSKGRFFHVKNIYSPLPSPCQTLKNGAQKCAHYLNYLMTSNIISPSTQAMLVQFLLPAPFLIRPGSLI